MIKRKIKKELREIEIIEKEKFFCDKCKNQIKNEYPHNYIKCKFEIKRKETYYEYGSDGGYVEKEFSYFCEKCCEEIKKILIGIGVVFEKEEYDW